MTKKVKPRFIIAKNEWCARTIIKMVNRGAASDDVFFESEHDAHKRMKKMPISQREQYSIFRVG